MISVVGWSAGWLVGVASGWCVLDTRARECEQKTKWQPGGSLFSHLARELVATAAGCVDIPVLVRNGRWP
jgi:hypothetical protein